MYGEAGGPVRVAGRKSPPIPAALLAVIQKGPFSASVRAAQLEREGGGREGSQEGEPGSRAGAVTTALEKTEKQDRGPRLQPVERRANLLPARLASCRNSCVAENGAYPILLSCFSPLVRNLGGS